MNISTCQTKYKRHRRNLSPSEELMLSEKKQERLGTTGRPFRAQVDMVRRSFASVEMHGSEHVQEL